MDEIYVKLKELLNKKIKRKNFDIDSLDAAELIITIEDEFNLPEVSQDEMMEIKSIKDLHDLIESKKK